MNFGVVFKGLTNRQIASFANISYDKAVYSKHQPKLQ